MQFEVRRSRRDSAGWTWTPCMRASCQKKGVVGRLCNGHHADLLETVRTRLHEVGITEPIHRVGISQELYVTVTAGSVRRQRLEHRLLFEAMLGRQLLTSENVHHINGVRYDNRPSNLELWVTAQPSGQRPRDLVAWARDIIERYGTEIG